MPDQRLATVVRHIRRIAARQDAGALSDGDLLHRFAERHDEGAFEALVWRHAGMVWSVCRRVLRHEQDAEDAFQATFLILVRRAASIVRREALASWLFKVAHRVALERKSKSAKVNCAALPVDRVFAIPDRDLDWRDVRPVLDEEISRLPDRFRAAVVLCYLEGKTDEEAARQLGCARGTIHSRLSRARERLRRRLTRRGVALSTGMLVAMAVGSGASAASVPGSLVSSTISAALLFAAGRSVAAVTSTSVLKLTEGALRTMLLSKLKILAVVTGTLAVAGWGIAAYSVWMNPQERNSLEHAVLSATDVALAAADPRRAGGADSRSEDQLRLAARKQKSQNNLKNLALAMHNYHDTYGHFPPPSTYSPDGKALLSWRVAILPFLSHDALYRKFRLDEAWNSAHNKELLKEMPDVFAPPGRPDVDRYRTFYQVFVTPPKLTAKSSGSGGGGSRFPRQLVVIPLGGEGIRTGRLGGGEGGGPTPEQATATTSQIASAFDKQRPVRISDITDGTSNTIMILEGAAPVPWTKPEDLVYEPNQPLPELGGLFKDVINAAFCDGSVRSIKKDFPEAEMRAAITRNGGEILDMDKLFASSAECPRLQLKDVDFGRPGGASSYCMKCHASGTNVKEVNQTLRAMLNKAKREMVELTVEVNTAKQAAQADEETQKLQRENRELEQLLQTTTEKIDQLKMELEQLKKSRPRPGTR